MITKYFEDVLGVKTVPEVRDEGKGYRMWDDGGVETSVGEFLYGLVSAVKPDNILETGLYSGISCSYLAQGIKDNGFGQIDSVEFEKQHIDRASQRLIKLGLDSFVNIHCISSLDFKPTRQYQIILLDTEPNLRFQELVNFYPYLEPGGFVFIHDLPRNFCQGNFNPDHPEIKSWPFGDLPIEIKNWLKDGDLVRFNLPSPRGMCGFYKPREDDYRPNS